MQTALDRAFYRDRYDYRRALVGFARDLNSDLDLERLGERLVARIIETLLVDRMVLLLADELTGDFEPIRAAGFAVRAAGRARAAPAIGGRVEAGHSRRARRSALGRGASPTRRSSSGATGASTTSCPASRRKARSPCSALGRKDSAEPLNSEDIALLAAVAGQVATALENAPPLPAAAHEGRGARPPARVQREHPRVARRRPRRPRPRRPRSSAGTARSNSCTACRGPLAIGRPFAEVFEPRFVEALCAARREHPDGATLYRVPLTSRGAADRPLLVNVATVPLRTHVGPDIGTTGTIIIIEDITERVQLEEQLQISEKMASIGLLAAGVAHEVNTPLTGISSFTQMLLEGADPDDPRTRLLEKIERQTFRAAKIVNGLLNLSRQNAPSGGDRATGRRQRRRQRRPRRCSSTSSRSARIKVRRELRVARAGRDRASSTSCSRCS